MLGYTGAGKYNIANNATGTVVDLYMIARNDKRQSMAGEFESPPSNLCCIATKHYHSNESSNDPAQIWEIMDEKDDTVSIINAATGSYVTVPPGIEPNLAYL